MNKKKLSALDGKVLIISTKNNIFDNFFNEKFDMLRIVFEKEGYKVLDDSGLMIHYQKYCDETNGFIDLLVDIIKMEV